MGKKGPKRKEGSSVKQRCCYKNCRKNCDVKNVGKHLMIPYVNVDKSKCRRLRSTCRTAKFCCAEHLRLARLSKRMAQRGERGKHPMDQQQLRKLFCTFLDIGCVWVAVLLLIQFFMGDRADAARNCRWSWLSIDPSGADIPAIQIPKVNGKTVERTNTLHSAFAKQLWSWAFQKPLQAGGKQWPAENQPVGGDELLFPGFDSKGQRRQWSKPISVRAYCESIRRAAKKLQEERAAATLAGETHAFMHYDLAKLGTHSLKKTFVCLLSEAGAPYPIIESLTGTSARVLQQHYDMPTPTRQARALSDVLGVMSNSTPQIDSSAIKANASMSQGEKISFCGFCGVRVASKQHAFCTSCGRKLSP